MSLTDSSVQNPHLLVFAGPNGSGKSTITQNIPVYGIYVNADEIKRISGCSDLDAAMEAEQIRELLLSSKKDFTFETVLSTERNLDLLSRAKEAGYEIYAVFVLTCEPAINVKRVKERAAAGGHDVPEEKIISRYHKSLANLGRLIRIADHTRIIDNSDDLPELICEVHHNSVTIYQTTNWSKSRILSLLSKQ